MHLETGQGLAELVTRTVRHQPQLAICASGDQPACVSTKRSFRSRVQNVYVIASRIMAAVTGCLGGWRLYTRESLGVQSNNNRDSLYAHVYNSINNGSPSDLKVNRVLSLRNPHPFAVSSAYPSHALSIV